ncbi:hypothetical protein ES703_119427 [subsurface metagenome]
MVNNKSLAPLIITLTAILAITALEILAILHDINGILLSAVTIVLAGLAGYEVKKLRK